MTVSDHPLGHIDGISLIAVVGAVRPDLIIKGMIDTMDENFVVVNPYD